MYGDILAENNKLVAFISTYDEIREDGILLLCFQLYEYILTSKPKENSNIDEISGTLE